jgi:RND family efflux transporter MFP subunit
LAPTTPTRLRSPILTAGAIAALGLLVAACGGGAKDKTAPVQRQSVTAATVNTVNLPRIVNASGSVTAWEEVPVGAETGGLVATGVFVDEGSYVRQGQALVQLNDAVLRAQLNQQQAAVQTAEANLSRDDAALARSQELKSRGFLSQASLDTAQANQRSSAAGVASARAALSQTQTQLNQATVRAPVSGLVIRRSVTRGQIVQPGTELFRIVRDGRLELDAQVPETELPLIRSGMSAVVVSDQGGETTGRVRIVTSEVDPQSRLGIARVAGETAPIMFTAAYVVRDKLPWDVEKVSDFFFQGVMALPYHIYVVSSKIPQNEYTERVQYGTAFVFLVIVALIATCSIVMRNKLRNRYKW